MLQLFCFFLKKKKLYFYYLNSISNLQILNMKEALHISNEGCMKKTLCQAKTQRQLSCITYSKDEGEKLNVKYQMQLWANLF